jgi:dihydrofolate synthase/folylpolyglutamate synthase
MDFQKSLEYLYALGNEVAAMKLGLESTEKLLAALGNPHKNFLKVQIAGTNGKGSTCAFLDSICSAANIKTGLFTSPHLVSITERIKIEGLDISEKDFARHAGKIREICESLVEKGELETVPTFFEQMTAIAVSVFAEAKIELAILETGLGGRLDSVTATRAEIIGITPIDYDHQNILGNSLTEIAAEKAAIIREDAQVLIAPQKKEAKQVIIGKCREIGIESTFISNDVKVNQLVYADVLDVTITTKKDVYSKLMLSLTGRHQFVNAALAIEIAESLRDHNFKITRDNILHGLETTRHKGRLEFINGILFDGAHNIAGAKALKDYLDEFFKQPVTMIFGAMRDKDVAEIAGTLFPKADFLILTKPDNSRAMEPDELMRLVPEDFDKAKVFTIETVKDSIEKARAISGQEKLILLTGSLYLVGEAQNLLKH